MSPLGRLGLILLLVAYWFWVGLMIGGRARAEMPTLPPIVWSPQPTYKPDHDELVRAQRAIVTFPKPEKRNPHLPPIEFDHEYEGTLIVSIFRANVAGVMGACNHVKVPRAHIALGCAVITGERCDVYIATDDLLFAYGISYDVMWRHERGHCNGWRHAQEYK